MTLRNLSDHELLSRIQTLRAREREFTIEVLLHLNEIKRRDLHLKQGYSSLFDYCTSGLGYSRSSAGRRIFAARAIRRFPEIIGLLQAGDVTISTVAQVSRLLTHENRCELLGRIRNKSQREVEEIVASYQPSSWPRDRVRTIVVRVPVPPAEAPQQLATKTLAEVADPVQEMSELPDVSDPSEPPLEPAPDLPSDLHLLETRALIQFSAGKDFMDRLERLRSLLWHRLPANASLEQVFGWLMDDVLEREDPSRRRERRERRNRQAAALVSHAERTDDTYPAADPRQIPAAVRDDVYVRDQARCTYVASDGRRCESTRALQIDHIQPVARGGQSTPSNLRLLCAWHNRLEAGRVLGSKCAEKTRERDPRPLPLRE